MPYYTIAVSSLFSIIPKGDPKLRKAFKAPKMAEGSPSPEKRTPCGACLVLKLLVLMLVLCVCVCACVPNGVDIYIYMCIHIHT